MDTPYSNRELDEKFTDFKAQLDRIETQTTKTNGSVRSLQIWRAYMLGFCGCITIIILPIGFVLLTSYLKSHGV